MILNSYNVNNCTANKRNKQLAWKESEKVKQVCNLIVDELYVKLKLPLSVHDKQRRS